MVWAAGRDNRRLSGHPLSEGLFKLRWRRFDFVLVSVPSGLITAITVVPAIGSGRQAMALALEYVTLLARFL